MDKPTRADHTARLHAFIEDALDFIERSHPDGFDLGIVALVYECQEETRLSDYLKRSDARYTPDDDVSSYIGWWCSDHRPWIQDAFFENALRRPPRYQPSGDVEADEADDEESEEG